MPSFPQGRRRVFGLVAGPLLFLILLLLPTPDGFLAQALRMGVSVPLAPSVAWSMHCVGALAVLMILWWITEAVPIPVTALLPGVLFPLFHVQGWVKGALASFDAKAVFSNYGHPIIFLFFGGFLLAAAMQKWKLDRRLTLAILSQGNLADNTRAVLFGMMALTAFLSMWISNTAATAMMLPLALGILSQTGATPGRSSFGTALLLGCAWAASIGGVGTIIGTPPNGICVALLESSGLRSITFLEWMAFGVPFVIIMLPVAWGILLLLHPPETTSIPGGKALMMRQKKELGPLTREERLLLAIFLLTALLWVSSPFWPALLPGALASGLTWFDENVIIMFSAVLLFTIPATTQGEPLLEWSDTTFVDWGTLLLFGGGIALSDGMFRTGLASWIATSVVSLTGHPSTLVLLLVIVLLIDFLTEVTSNTAVTTMMIPIIISIAMGTGANPVLLSVGAAVAASMAFMLPVATPPNALVYGTGYVPIRAMVRAGFSLDIAGWLLTVAIVYGFAHLALGMFW